MTAPDRRHGVAVARDAVRMLGPAASPREVVAAALLHDVGKIEASLGTFARVGVTVAAMTFGRPRVLNWANAAQGPDTAQAGPSAPSGPEVPQSPHRRSLRVRTGTYLAHDAVGARLLEDAGSDPLTVTWAREHHLAPGRWTVDAPVAASLKAADGD